MPHLVDVDAAGICLDERTRTHLNKLEFVGFIAMS